MHLTTSGLPSSASSVLPLQSAKGQVLLQRSYDARRTSKVMVDAYTRQDHQFSSGVASLVVLINALNVAYRIKYDQVEERSRMTDLLNKGHTFVVTEKDVFGFSKVAKYLEDNRLTKSNLTLGQLHSVALYLGFGSNSYYACSEGNCNTNDESAMKSRKILGQDVEGYKWKNVGDFRTFAKDYVMRKVTGVIVNYDRRTLDKESEGGHFSPLAGYDEVSDRFLVMDVGTEEGGVWVRATDLFKAMTIVDPLTDVPRGCLHVHELLI